jgi:ribosomal protein L6P/L9E
MQPGVDVELQLYGNSLENVSQSAADIQQICRVRNKDIRKVSFRAVLLKMERMVLTTKLVLGRSVRFGEGQHQ